MQTGFGRFADAKATPLYNWGVGPSLDGIFSQSNLGIVTKMTILLMPIPNFFQSFNFFVKDSSQLDSASEIFQNLMLKGILKDNCLHIWNCYKILAKEGRYPWKVMQGKIPLLLKELKGCEPYREHPTF